MSGRIKKRGIVRQRKILTARAERRIAVFLVTAASTLLFLFVSASAACAAHSAPSQASVNVPLSNGPAELEQAKALIREGKFQQAETVVRRYLNSGQDGESARSLLGLILYQEGRWPESLAEFTRAAKFQTPTASELIVVGLDYVMLNQLTSADRWMTLAAQREPQNEAAWRYLGGIKYSENRFAEAIDAYKKCLALHPRQVLVEDGIGRSLEGLSRDDDAAAAYHTALDWQSQTGAKYPQPLLHLGALLARRGQTQPALGYLLSAETLAPKDEEIHEQLGMLREQLRDLKDAQWEIEQALRLSPANSHLHWVLAGIYRKEGRTEASNRELQRYSALLGTHSSDKLP